MITGTNDEGKNGFIVTITENVKEGRKYFVSKNGDVGKYEETQIAELTDIYVNLYDDGTLVFSNNSELMDGKTLKKSYGNIKGKVFSFNPENNGIPTTPWLDVNNYTNEDEMETTVMNITTIVIANKIVPQNMCAYFASLAKVNKIENLNNIDMSRVEDMSYMFAGCYSLTNLDLSGINAPNVQDMSYMFSICLSLTDLNLSGFNAPNVKNVSYMFYSCGSETSNLKINFDNFNIANAENVTYMFYGCFAPTLDLTEVKMDTVTNLGGMFYACMSTSIKVGNWGNSKVTNMSTMFTECFNLKEVDLGKLNTESVTNMDSMFNECANLENINLSNFNTKNVTTMREMFIQCEKLKKLDLSRFDTSNVTDMAGMFYLCTSLENLDLSNFNTENVTDMGGIFYRCNMNNIKGITNWNVDKVTNFYNAFGNITGDEVDISGWNISQNAEVTRIFLQDNTSTQETKITVYLKDENIKNYLEAHSSNSKITYILKQN